MRLISDLGYRGAQLNRTGAWVLYLGAALATHNPLGIIFSNSTNTLSAAIQARFITPTANRTAIKSQQQPRQ